MGMNAAGGAACKWRRSLLTLLLIAPLMVSCKKDTGRVAAPPPENLSILYTCDTRGHIEPCGCASGQAGGIARRMTYMRDNVSGPAILVDAGDVTAGPRNWEVFEMEYILKGYVAMGYDAVNAGHREASLGKAKLQELNTEYDLFVSANLLDESGQTVLPPYRVVELDNGYRIGILGVMDDRIDAEDRGEGLIAAPPIDAVGKYLPEVVKQSDFIVVLAYAEEDLMRSLAEQFYELDVIVGGRVLQPTRDPIKVNQSRLVYITDKGKAIGRLDIAFDAEGDQVFSNDIHMLLDDIVDDPEITEIVDEFKLRLADMDFQPHRDDEEGLTTITSARSSASNKFLAAESCKQCHPQAFAKWTESSHSHSFDSLVQRKHAFNPRCLQCHTVGYGSSDGYINQRLTPTFASVSCGNCHGRGEYHTKFHLGEDVPPRAALLKSVNCMTCHDPENSPEFNFETYWEQIGHGVE